MVVPGQATLSAVALSADKSKRRRPLPAQRKAAEQDLVGACEVVIAKQRNGPRTTVPLNFEERYTRFETHQRQYLAAPMNGGAFPAGAWGPVACS